MSGQGPDRPGGTHHLEGRFVTDVPGLHRAMAEALVGPGGYFCREWNAFKDCLGGGFGMTLPFTLIWHDADVARRALAGVVSDPDEGFSNFEESFDCSNAAVSPSFFSSRGTPRTDECRRRSDRAI